MKSLLTFLLLFCSVRYCEADYWTQKSDFPGSKRYRAFAFSIDTKGYVGSGMSSLNSVALKDFWEYDPNNNAWTQKADFGGDGRWNAIGLSILNRGYAGLGIDSSGNVLNDFWEYNPLTNFWLQMANCPTGGLRLSSFTINTVGYITQTTPPSLFQFDPSLNQWNQKAFFNANGRQGAVSFSIGNKGYYGTGWFPFLQDFWEYDPVTDIWMQKANVPNPPRGDAAGFSIGNKGYLGTGEGPNSVSYLNDFWQFDPNLNQWNQKANFPGANRDETIYFSIGNKGYIGLGGHDNIPQFLYLDFWEYTADSLTNINESNTLKVSVYPNPFTDKTLIAFNRIIVNGVLKLFDSSGKNVKVITEISGRQLLLERDRLNSGMYTFLLVEEEEFVARGKLFIQ